MTVVGAPPTHNSAATQIVAAVGIEVDEVDLLGFSIGGFVARR